jgi:hypothetical protein
VRREGDCGPPTSCASVTVTVNTSSSTAPTDVSANPPTICAGSFTMLSASGGTAGTGSNLVWYTGSCGGTMIGIGPSIWVNPTSTTTYYVRREGDCGPPTSCASVTVTVDPDAMAPTSASASPSTICAGQSTTLSASGGTMLGLVWYTDGCGFSYVGSGSSITVSPTSTTTYYVREEAGCGAPTGCASVTVTVDDGPGGTVSGPTTLCRGESYTFSTTDNATSYNWFATGAPEITFSGSGPTVTVNVGWGTTSSTNICVTPFGGSCGSGSNRCQSVNIVASPSVEPISGPEIVCRGKAVVFSVPNQPGVTYNWSYSGSGVDIASGQGTHSITANFYLTATSGVLTVTASNGSCSASSSIYITTVTPYWALVDVVCTITAHPPGQPPPGCASNYTVPPNYPCTGAIEGTEVNTYESCRLERTQEGGWIREHCLGKWRCTCEGPQ